MKMEYGLVLNKIVVLVVHEKIDGLQEKNEALEKQEDLDDTKEIQEA